MAWFGRKRDTVEHDDVAGDDSPTGQIAAQVISNADAAAQAASDAPAGQAVPEHATQVTPVPNAAETAPAESAANVAPAEHASHAAPAEHAGHAASPEHATHAAPAEQGTPAADTAQNAEIDRLRAERAELIRLCLYALDRARSGGVVERLEEGLAGVGVTALRPDGEKFDPAVHEAGGTVPTTDPDLDGTIAETELVGFRDGDKVLRAPIVTVYSVKAGETG
uniref:Nucleotide exchange factor GrpE n=2 Tax=Thermocrispum agreste TaxID=37925 RepID=A0A2W4L5I5_9PSEU|nr:MAG: nucleotide exchange factor GrpE [Thermocrispum agreste]